MAEKSETEMELSEAGYQLLRRLACCSSGSHRFFPDAIPAEVVQLTSRGLVFLIGDRVFISGAGAAAVESPPLSWSEGRVRVRMPICLDNPRPDSDDVRVWRDPEPPGHGSE